MARDPFPPLDVAGRLDRLEASLAGAGCDALLVTDLMNVRYLTGFTGSAARLVVRVGDAALVTDGRYEDQAVEELERAGAQARVVVGRSQQAQRELLGQLLAGVDRLGLEAASVPWADQRSY